MASQSDIILVSTEPVIQQLLQRVLESMKLPFRLAVSAAEASRLLAGKDIELFIADLQNREMDEAQLAADFLGRSDRGAVLLLSNTRSALTPKELNNHPRCQTLTKPVEIADLKAAILQLRSRAC